MMSWSSATIAPIAIFGSKRSARNATTATRKTTSAISAWSVMSRPQSALTVSGLTSPGWTPAAVGDGVDDGALGVLVEGAGAQQHGVPADHLSGGHLGTGVLGRLPDLVQLLLGAGQPEAAPALEVDAEVEAAERDGQQAEQDQDSRDLVDQPAVADDVQAGLTVVEPVPEPGEPGPARRTGASGLALLGQPGVGQGPLVAGLPDLGVGSAGHRRECGS